MKLRLDRFTIVVLVVVGLLLLAAVVTVNQGASVRAEPYRTADAPETPVVNAFLALQNGDIPMARTQYAAHVLETVDNDSKDGYGPLRGDPYYGDSARRLRLIDTRLDEQDSDRAFVTVALDTYASGGPFSSGSTWTTERVVDVVREDGVWKINSPEFFY